MAHSKESDPTEQRRAGIAAGRLDASAYKENFADLNPRLSGHEAIVEADRCYFCFDAPCMSACPTAIDVPLFIRQIQSGNPGGAAKTIFDQNILGGMCARVCPTETLCEQVCVRNDAAKQPVRIGALQRYATDHAMAAQGAQNSGSAEISHPFTRAADTGKRIAVIGAGPAGLACAHRLARFGHEVKIFDAREKPGGLNEFGIAAYKTVNNFAQREVEFILSVGGITIETGKALGKELALAELRRDYDAVFLGLGLSGVNGLGIAGATLPGVEDAVTYIARLRQAEDVSAVPIGRRVVVIGGGMTAIDVAVQAKLLGALDVTICYRRGKARMSASQMEQELAQTKGVTIIYNVQPVRLKSNAAGAVSAIELAYTRERDGALAATGETFELAADMVFKAIGQTFDAAGILADVPLALEQGRLKVDASFATSAPGIWAGGDCIIGGEDLTVAAVDDGRRAAEAINKSFAG